MQFGTVGIETYGHERYVNQTFYHSPEWRSIRNVIILRDNGNELGLDGYPINGRVHVHHLNAIDVKDISENSKYLLDPEYLVCMSEGLHKAITYGDSEYFKRYELVERKQNDTVPWKL